MILDGVSSLMLAGLAITIGSIVLKQVRWLREHNFPSAVVGGLLLSILFLIVRKQTGFSMQCSKELQAALMLLFFTTLGFEASFRLLGRGSKAVTYCLFWMILLTILQNVVGVGLAYLFGQPLLVGVLTSSVSLVGGPGTAAAFAPAFEKAGVEGALLIGIASAMGGIVLGGIFGAPVSTLLIRKHNLKSNESRRSLDPNEQKPEGHDSLAHLLPSIIVLAITMWSGNLLGQWIQGKGVTLPSYIGAMVIGAAIRNINDRKTIFQFDGEVFAVLGNIALALFLAMALINLELERLSSMAAWLITNLFVQLGLVVAFSVWVLFPAFKKNYNGAVLSGGVIGFMMGTTANALSNMEAVTRVYGPSREAFFVASLVGACFIDFANAAIITLFLNIL